MSFALASRRAAISPAWVKNPLWRAARAVPSLDLQFADTKSLADAVTGQSLITFTRASSGTYVGSDGVLQTAANDVPRFDHNPTTGESLGLLAEEQRTNSIRNNTMVGAVAGTPGTVPTNWNDIPTSNGLSRQIVGVGTQAGISYIDIRYSGTTSAAASTVLQPEVSSATVAATGQSWTASSWLALVAGSISGLTFIQRVTGRSSVGGFLENTDTTVALSSTLTRYAASITMANASTLRVSNDIFFAYNNGVAIDITLRIGLPQLEQGAFATSAIPTTTAAATRSADVASITGTAFSSWYRQDEGTVFAEYRLPAAGIGIVNIDDGTANNNIPIFVGATVLQAASANAIVAGVNNGRLDSGGSFTANSLTRAAYAIKVTDRALSANGATATTSATPSAMPVVTQLQIQGATIFTSGKGGTIRRLTFWPARIPNSTLQAITQ